MNIFAQVYVDEDVDVLVATLLSARGFNATTAREQSMLGKADTEQLAFAATCQRCILTHNRLDFEQLHKHSLANNQPHAGILIAKRRNAYEIAERVAILIDTLTSYEIANQLFYV
jgi:predicted nuclease of predicted toxin-antitoxin system